MDDKVYNKERFEFLKERDFDVLEIWERDYRLNKDAIIKDIIKYIEVKIL